jgi:hypothetical protein
MAAMPSKRIPIGPVVWKRHIPTPPDERTVVAGDDLIRLCSPGRPHPLQKKGRALGPASGAIVGGSHAFMASRSLMTGSVMISGVLPVRSARSLSVVLCQILALAFI